MEFADDQSWIQHVLEHRLDPDAIKNPIIKRQFVGVGHQHGVRRGIDVGADQLDGIVAVEFICARTNRAAADHKDDRLLDLLLEKIDELRAV